MSDGYCYGDMQPTEYCPYCQTISYADFVDVGVGYTKCGPYHCENCGASEIGAYDEKRNRTDNEKKFGWYEPGSVPGSSANVIDGKIVDHQTMTAEYKEAFTGNPLYHVEGEVELWFERKRVPKDVSFT